MFVFLTDQPVLWQTGHKKQSCPTLVQDQCPGGPHS